MRVTQGMMYNSMQTNMNNVLSDYMESNMQGATQKRINRPSDDPAGTIKILNYRASLATTDQYISNSKDAASWLSSTDSALQQSQVVLTRLSELAEQAATGTYTAEQRLDISYEVRELYEQLINIANTEYAGDHLFAGQKTSESAYDFALGVTSNSPELEDVDFAVSGAADRTIMVRFTGDGVIGTTTPPVAGDLPTETKYEYSKDGGETWVTGTLPAGDTKLDLDGVEVDFRQNFTGDPLTNTSVNVSDETLLYVRPAAQYKGDDNDNPPEVDIYGKGNITNADASGRFPSNVQIRFDSDANVNTDGELQYSYSKDNGLTWEPATATTPTAEVVPPTNPLTREPLRIIVPGGYVDVAVGGDGSLKAGQQMVVRPDRASEIGFEIADGEFIDVAHAGKDIFGGIYQGKGDTIPTTVEGTNIFETISDLIAWTETDNQDGCGESLEELKKASEHLLTQLAKVGGKSNRVSLNVTILQSSSDDQTTRMSSIEDIDITTLSIKLTKQKMAYESVLQSSSMIMNMSLMNYL